jgi:hypothetical protein
MISAVISIGRITPVDCFAPKIKAITGTAASPKPLRPAFDIPRISAAKRKRKK